MRIDLSIVIFVATLVATLVVAYLGRRHEDRQDKASLASQGLSRWLVGLSAGATANSGFVVTAAVGLGYTAGARWLLLPLAWLLGDIVFWLVFPARINALGARANARTLTDVIVHEVPAAQKRTLQLLIGLVVVVCLGGYVSAQWVAGQKFLSGAFGFGSLLSLITFAAVIVAYSALGGFRGSVYADTLQAAIRILGTAVAVAAISVAASKQSETFWRNLEAAGPNFLTVFPDGGLMAVAFVLGFAASALGFGLGQPQMVTRYLAGASPNETRAAWWIYMLFVQSTWIAMTLFGMALRGVMPDLADPEMGLSVFHRATTGPILTGIIAADIFATIAATSNSILVAMAQTLKFDLLRGRQGEKATHNDLWMPIIVLGAATMGLSLWLHASVVGLVMASVSLMGAGIAPAMMIRVMNWRYSGSSLLTSIIVGFASAALWRYAGYGAIINEAAPGILAGLLANAIVASRAGRVLVLAND